MSLIKTNEIDPNFWNKKRIFLTGHTGFKGGWLSIWLASMGAKITGYSMEPKASPNFFDIVGVHEAIDKSVMGDIRNISDLKDAITFASPDIVIHMAAQPLVRYSYENPIETFSTNVMGTVNVLESIRGVKCVRAVLIVTTDKCYENKEWNWGYREIDTLGGYDPYSNSKACAELVTASYRESFFPHKLYEEHGVAVATVRAGNVIGGGDWSADRLIPDAIRAFESNKILVIRNPLATRPWQHVLEPLSGYLLLAQALFNKGTNYGGAWNFGPNDKDARSVQEVVDLLIKKWKKNARWKQEEGKQPHEANSLKLDCSKAGKNLGWYPKNSLEEAVSSIVEWHSEYRNEANMKEVTLNQIRDYILIHNIKKD